MFLLKQSTANGGLGESEPPSILDVSVQQRYSAW